MNAKDMSNVKAIKYFNNLNVKENKQISEDNLESLNEKVKLEFSLQNAIHDFSYSIKANLINEKSSSYNSEQTKPHTDNSIIFENFYVCDYYFEKEQKIQIIINKNNNPITINTTLGCIVGARYSTFIKKYEGNETLAIKAEKMGKNDLFVDIKFSMKENDKDHSNYFINNKILYVITCKDCKIYSSEAINNEGQFNTVEIPSCLLYPYYTVNFYNCYNQLISTFNKNVDELNSDQDKLQLKIPIYNNNYLFLYDYSELKEHFSFLDFIGAGIRIGLSIGIDFTGSNGHPLDDGTLHSIKGKKPNDYERAIKACGNIVAYYDYDKLFPVYGFGAILNNSQNKEASMCFNLNFQNNADIYNIDNIIKIYHECIEKDKLTFAGPTEFAPIINKVISKITKNKLEYHILMILTDGVIDDLKETINALVDGSFEPLSVIIIGVGDADFKKMEILDGDEVPLVSSKGKKRLRDLVQFVPFSKFQNDEIKLSKKVLEEIPKQIVDYYTINNLTPHKIKILLSQKNKMEYPSFDEINKFNFDSIPTNETVYINPYNKKKLVKFMYQKLIQIYQMIQKLIQIYQMMMMIIIIMIKMIIISHYLIMIINK